MKRQRIEQAITAQEISGELETQWGIRDFQVRVGVNTGSAALGGITEAEGTVMGSTFKDDGSMTKVICIRICGRRAGKQGSRPFNYSTTLRTPTPPKQGVGFME